MKFTENKLNDLKFYQYVFYRLVKFRNNKISTTNSIYATILLMTIILIMYVYIAILLLEGVSDLEIISDKINKNIVSKSTIPVSLLIINLIYFYKNKKYKQILNYFEAKNADVISSIHDKYVIIFLIAPFIIALTFIILGITGVLD